MKAISGLPARGVPMLPAVGACRHSRQGSLLQIPSSGGKLGSEGRSSGGCRVKRQFAIKIDKLSITLRFSFRFFASSAVLLSSSGPGGF